MSGRFGDCHRLVSEWNIAVSVCYQCWDRLFYHSYSCCRHAWKLWAWKAPSLGLDSLPFASDMCAAVSDEVTPPPTSYFCYCGCCCRRSYLGPWCQLCHSNLPLFLFVLVAWKGSMVCDGVLGMLLVDQLPHLTILRGQLQCRPWEHWCHLLPIRPPTTWSWTVSGLHQHRLGAFWQTLILSKQDWLLTR